MILFVISCVFLFYFVSVHANHTVHNPLMRSSPEIVRSQVFTRLRVLKERIAVQIVKVKVKAINNAC